MKQSSPCDCSTKSKCIVITIETCHKKTTEDSKKPPPPKPKGEEEKVPEEVREAPPVGPQSTSIEDLTPEQMKSASQIRQKDPSRHDVEPVEEEEEEEAAPEEEPPQQDPKAESRVQIAEPEPPTQQVHRLFKLPLLVDRHHGKGCAMEISVLERHEESCMYKKEDVEGRTIDDRVGSYDCIGRMVFRTCNSSETESDGSKIAIHGGSAGDKGAVQMVNPTPTQPSKARLVQPPPPGPAPSPSRRISDEEEGGSLKGGTRSGMKSASKTASFDTAEEAAEEGITPVTEEKVEMARAHRYSAPHKKHYPGDGCKLRPPRDPLVSKVRTMHEPRLKINVCCQTEETAMEKYSLETMGSIGEERRRSSFLGSIFRKGLSGKPNAIEYRK